MPSFRTQSKRRAREKLLRLQNLQPTLRYYVPVEMAIQQGLGNVRLEGLPPSPGLAEIIRLNRKPDGTIDINKVRSLVAAM